jgi:hypothetical protein
MQTFLASSKPRKPTITCSVRYPQVRTLLARYWCGPVPGTAPNSAPADAKDTHVQSYAYDPVRRRLEIFYKWKSGSQYYPITTRMFQQIEGSNQIHQLLDEWIKQRRIRWDEVRTERKLVAEMLCGVRLIVERMQKFLTEFQGEGLVR